MKHTSPVVLFFAALAAITLFAYINGPEIGFVVGSIESLSSSSSLLIQRFFPLFPLGFAFSAGMVAAVNPCGFAMLPAYLGIYLGENTNTASTHPQKLRQALIVGISVTFGFIFVFSLIGIPMSLGTRSAINFFPWLGLSVGALLLLAGSYMLFGGEIYSSVPARISSKLNLSVTSGTFSYFIFGIAFGLASLSCTLPIFLAVISTSGSGSVAQSAYQILLYGSGMGLVMLLLTLSIAVFRETTIKFVRKTLPYIQIVSSLLLIFAGLFITYYWLTLGELLGTLLNLR